MTVFQQRVDEALSSPWAADVRARGGAVYIAGPSGNMRFADDVLATWIGLDVLPPSIFDVVSPDHAGEAGQAIAACGGKRFTVRFPLVHKNHDLVWTRWEGYPEPPSKGFIGSAWLEEDPAWHRVHVDVY